MAVTLVVTKEISDDLARAAKLPVESAGILRARLVEDEWGGMRLLARSMDWVPDEEYLVRTPVELTLSAQSYVRPLAQAERDGEIAIWVHTHPDRSPPVASDKDRLVESQIAEVFRIRTDSDYFVTLIVSQSANGFDFAGKLEDASDSPTRRLDRIWCVGDRWKLRTAFDVAADAGRTMFDRNIRAFGPVIQRTVSGLRIGIVGCGGTGSSVAEQLVRLGARQLTLIDPDTLSDSNVTRVYGSAPADVGRPKVEILSNALKHIAPDLDCTTVKGMITTRAVAERLMGCDVVFGCTDDNAGRIVLSRLSTYFIVPVIDCGVLLTNDADGQLTDINGRISTMVPGQACMICRGRVDLVRARTEMLTPEERMRLENEGYAPSLGRVEPAVVTFTTTVAALAVTEMLERLIGFGADLRPSEMLIRFHDREISTNLTDPLERHFCNPQQGKLGKGMTEPFLEQVWP